MSDTPLSDVMAAHLQAGTPESYTAFTKMFQASVIGIVALAAPNADEPHEAPEAGLVEGDVAAAWTTHGDGQSRILAFADPAVASQIPDSQRNAGLPGATLLQMAVKDPALHGILVNSATAPNSIIISTKTATELTQAKP